MQTPFPNTGKQKKELNRFIQGIIQIKKCRWKFPEKLMKTSEEKNYWER